MCSEIFVPGGSPDKQVKHTNREQLYAIVLIPINGCFSVLPPSEQVSHEFLDRSAVARKSALEK